MTRMRPADAATALWPAVLLVTVGVAGFLALLDWVEESEDLARIDQPLLEWFAAHRTDGVTDLLTTITDTFGPVILPVIVAAIALIWRWRSGSWWFPALFTGAMVLSTLLTAMLKWVVDRDRPVADLMSIPGLESSGSFPSGHTVGAATLVLVVGYLLWHDDEDAPWRLAAWTVLSLVVIATVALSRLYLGYHFLTDVLAGACVAVAVLGVVVGVERWHDLAIERAAPVERPHALRRADDAAESDAGAVPSGAVPDGEDGPAQA